MDLLPLLLMFGLLGAMMYFMSRRQRRAQAQQAQLQNSLSVGDRVMTTSGMYGTVCDTSSETTIGIEIAPGLETEWLRAAVREKVGPDVEDDEEVVDDLDDELDTVEDDDLVDDEVEDTDSDRVDEPSLESNKQK